MEKVFTGRVLCACIKATTVEELIPPDRNAPSGTSAIIRSLTESRSSASSRSTASFSSGAGSLRACPAMAMPRRSQKHFGAGDRPGRSVRIWPGGSFDASR